MPQHDDVHLRPQYALIRVQHDVVLGFEIQAFCETTSLEIGDDYNSSMPHPWQLIKNSRVGGHRPIEEFHNDLIQALTEFEHYEGEGFALQSTVYETLGLLSGEQVVNLDDFFSSPYPFMQSHGEYLCGLMSTPTSADDGISEFTSLFILASKKQLLTVILDPPTTYAGPFGQRLINRRDRHMLSTCDDVATTLLMIVRDNVTSLNFALRELSLDTEHIENVIKLFGSDEKHDNFDSLNRIGDHLVRMRIEIDSLETIVQATATLVHRLSTEETSLIDGKQMFDRQHKITAEMLELQALQTVSIRNRLHEKVDALSTKCDSLRDKFFVEATHRIGAVAALLLVPTFIVGLYGQNFDFPEKQWAGGYMFSWILISVSTVLLFSFFKRKKWL